MFFKKNVTQQHFDSEQNYTYPQFVIDEKTGQVDVNFIDWASGRVLRHIPAAELNDIVRNHGLDSK